MAHRRVLVFGEDNRSFLTVVRSLGRRGIEVHAVPLERSPALYSRYISKIHHLPPFDHSRRWINALRKQLDRYDYDLLIPTCERSILCLDAHCTDLDNVPLALPGEKVLQNLFDKLKTRQLASSLDVPIAEGRQMSSEDTPASLLEKFSLPLVIKPSCTWKRDNLVDRRSAMIARSEDQLARLFGVISDPGNYVCEQFFDGFGVGVSVLAAHGRILTAFQHERLHEPQAGGGSSLRKSQTLNLNMLDACRKIAAATDLHGVAMFEFRQDRASDQWLLLEVNARFWGSLPLPVMLGVDFPYYLFELLVDGIKTGQIEYPVGIRARNITVNAYDILVRDMFESQPSLGRLLRDLTGLLAHPVLALIGREKSDTFQSDDLAPAIVELLALPLLVISKGFRALLHTSRETDHALENWRDHEPR